MATNALRRLRRHQKLGCACRVLLDTERHERWAAVFPDGYMPVLGPEPTQRPEDPGPCFTLDQRRLSRNDKLVLAQIVAERDGTTIGEVLTDLYANRFRLLAEGTQMEACHYHRKEASCHST